MPATRARQYPQAIPGIVAGPFTAGTRDDRNPASGTPERLRYARNVYREYGSTGVRIVGRPGFATAGAKSPAGAAKGQWCGQLTKASGTTYTIRIIGGRLETYNWSNSTWTEAVTTANLTTASITLDATARVYAAYLADSIIFHDGVNKPWQWDGTTGAGGLTSLTNAPVMYGQTWVYYAKFFGVKSTDRSTFVWCEENQPNLGYEAGGYNNAWNPLGAAGFTGGCGTNQAMYVFQDRRIIAITGAVSTDFQTAGTRSQVSEKVGSMIPPLVLDAGVAFVDDDARLNMIPLGGLALPFWGDCRETLKSINTGSLSCAQLVDYRPANLLLIGLPSVGQTVMSTALVFSLPGGAPQFEGVWDGWSADTMGMVLDSAGAPTLMHLGASDGYAYVHGNPNGVTWNDTSPIGTAAITHTVTTGAVGADPAIDKVFDIVTVLTACETDMSSLTLSAVTPRGSTGVQSQTVSGQGTRLGSTFILGTSMLVAGSDELRTPYGVSWFGRWASPTLTHSALNQRFGLVALEFVAFDSGEDASTP